MFVSFLDLGNDYICYCQKNKNKSSINQICYLFIYLYNTFVTYK
jgi:hypothetical protein